MRLRLDYSMNLGIGEHILVRSANTVIQALRDARIGSTGPIEPATSRDFEVIWRHASPMEGYDTDWVPHRVVRWTAQTVLVEAHPAVPGDQPDEQSNGRRRQSYWLDRRDLERYGVARVRSRKIAFFSSPDVTAEAVRTVESLLRLGLWFPFNDEDLRYAYIRRASQHHPDAGGSDEKFIQLQEDQERAAIALRLHASAPGS
jgi:hypothetical protein